MALTATFNADFTDFQRACRDAEVSLRGFDAGSRQVESSLNRLVDNWSGRKIIQEANVMAEAIGRIGGPSRLTASEIANVRDVTEQAAEKFRRFGAQVPPNLQRVLDATDRNTAGQTRMSKAIADTDNVLDLFGVNLGPARRALDDLEQAGGKTVKQLGLLGTASLAAGAATGGWQFGRWIAGWADTDKAIGDATAKLLGWGDVAGETAAAKAAMLAKASKEVGFQVTSLSTAMAVNQAAAEATTAANKKLSDQFDAEKRAAKDLAAEIEKVHQSNADKFFKLTQDWVAAMHAREQAEIAAAAKGKQAMFDEIEAATKNAEAQKKLRDAGVEAQEAIKAKTDETTASFDKQREAADAARNATTFASFEDPTQAAALLARPERSREDFLRMYAGYSGGAQFAEQQYQIDQEIRRRAQAVLDAAKAQGYAGPGSTTYGGRTGGNPTQTINVAVSGLLDPRTITELTTAVGAALVHRTGAKVGI